MKIHRTMAMLIASAALTAIGLQAQVSNQALYSVKFRATAAADTGQGNGKKIKITDTDLINAAVGSGLSKRDAKRNYELVYNPSADSIQVVNQADGSLVSDVFLFEGGTNVVVGDELQRFTFVFSPTESEAIGSAVITERTPNNNNNNRARIVGKIQYALPANFTTTSSSSSAAIPMSSDTSNSESNVVTTPGDTNTVSVSNDSTNSRSDTNTTVDTGGFVQASAATATNTDVRIATGTFVAGRLFEPGFKNDNNNDNNGDNNNGDTNVVTGETSGTNTNGNGAVSSTNSTTDVRFVTTALQAGLTEVQLAQLALQNSTNQAVIDFAQQMIQDHTQANLQLTELAASKGIEVPTALNTANQQTVNRLATLQGTSFDRAYGNEAVSSHRQTIQLFQTEASKGDDPDIQAFAQNNLATLQQHFTEALQLP